MANDLPVASSGNGKSRGCRGLKSWRATSFPKIECLLSNPSFVLFTRLESIEYKCTSLEVFNRYIYNMRERVVSTPWGKKWSVMIIPNKLDILLSSQVVFFYWFQAANQLRIGNIPSVYIQIVLSHPDLCISILPEIIQTSIKHVQVLYLAEDYSFINLKIAELKTWSP